MGIQAAPKNSIAIVIPVMLKFVVQANSLLVGQNPVRQISKEENHGSSSNVR